MENHNGWSILSSTGCVSQKCARPLFLKDTWIWTVVVIWKFYTHTHSPSRNSMIFMIQPLDIWCIFDTFWMYFKWILDVFWMHFGLKCILSAFTMSLDAFWMHFWMYLGCICAFCQCIFGCIFRHMATTVFECILNEFWMYFGCTLILSACTMSLDAFSGCIWGTTVWMYLGCIFGCIFDTWQPPFLNVF